MNPNDKRLAIAVEDHPLEYGAFEGSSRRAIRRRGRAIWDAGTFIPLNDPAVGLDEGRLTFRLEEMPARRICPGAFYWQAQGVAAAEKHDADADATWKIERLTPSWRKVLKKIPPLRNFSPGRRKS
jgi:hypothetical protein